MIAFEYIFKNTDKSEKLFRELSLLAVRTAKYELLREPIRMVLFTMDHFSHMIRKKFITWYKPTYHVIALKKASWTDDCYLEEYYLQMDALPALWDPFWEVSELPGCGSCVANR